MPADSTASTTQSHVIIRMTDRAPVRIVEADWPIITKVCDGIPLGAHLNATITVRCHTDGRLIVYGHYLAAKIYAGYLLAAADSTNLIRAIHDVAAEIQAEELGQQCIQSLPAEDVA